MLDEIIIQTKDGIMQIAGLEKGRLGEFVIYDEKKANEGNVYLGKITKKIQTANGKEGYFVNIGAQREAFINAEEKDLEDLKAHEGRILLFRSFRNNGRKKVPECRVFCGWPAFIWFIVRMEMTLKFQQRLLMRP